jgi:hypothetical protein
MGDDPSADAPSSLDAAHAGLPVVGWLTYDSRSGSTALARRLDGLDERLWVTPEIGFDTVIGWSGRTDGSALPEMARRSMDAGDWINLGLDAPSIDEALRHAGHAASGRRDARSLLVRTLLMHSARKHGRQGVSHVLVKNGSHLRLTQSIRTTFGDSTRMIFLARDPRAVAESKLRTRRPYHPWETFAWGGCIHAAIRWKAYARAAIAMSREWNGLKVLRFEDYARSADTAGELLLGHLGLHPPHVPARARDGYAVPKKEEPIHKRAHDALDATLLDRWRESLDVGQRLVIERICRKEMAALGYAAERVAALRLALPLARESMRTAMGVTRHAILAQVRTRQDVASRGQVIDAG